MSVQPLYWWGGQKESQNLDKFVFSRQWPWAVWKECLCDLSLPVQFGMKTWHVTGAGVHCAQQLKKKNQKHETETVNLQLYDENIIKYPTLKLFRGEVFRCWHHRKIGSEKSLMQCIEKTRDISYQSNGYSQKKKLTRKEKEVGQENPASSHSGNNITE